MKDERIYKEYQVSASTTHSAAQALNFEPVGSDQRVIVQASGADIIFKFGDSTVQADATVTSNALTDGNFTVPNGAVMSLTISSKTETHFSVETASGTGTARVQLAR